MNDFSSNTANQPEPMSRREARRQRRAERFSESSRPRTLVAGLILIVLGGLFLLRSTGTLDIPFRNWWALFILLPAIGSLDTAWRLYQSAGNRLTAQAGGSLLVGAVLILVVAAFLLGWNWSYFGPVLLILAGIGFLFTYMLNGRQ